MKAVPQAIAITVIGSAAPLSPVFGLLLLEATAVEAVEVLVEVVVVAVVEAVDDVVVADSVFFC